MNKTRRLNVLIACECSGVVRREMRARGHNAWSCDMVKADDGSQYHIQGDALAALAGTIRGLITLPHERSPAKWDLVIAHPPCTFLSNSGALRLYRDGKKKNGPDPERWENMRAGAAFFRAFFREYDGPLCVENPVMHGHALREIIRGMSFDVPVKRQTIQPYNFNEDASKRTVLWLRGLPELKDTGFFPPRLVCQCGATYKYPGDDGCPSCRETNACALPRWSNQTDSNQNKLGPSETRAKERAETYVGIARAMASQWTPLTL